MCVGSVSIQLLAFQSLEWRVCLGSSAVSTVKALPVAPLLVDIHRVMECVEALEHIATHRAQGSYAKVVT